MQRVLAADIGGTNSRFASFALEKGVLSLTAVAWLPTEAAPSFAHLLEQWQTRQEQPDHPGLPLTPQNADAAVFAVAGAVLAGRRAKLANIPWDIDLDALPASAGCRNALLINDFAAQAWACASPAARNATTIFPGKPESRMPIAVLGAGTGFGHALLVPTESAPLVLASEGGHAHFPFIGPDETRFADFLRAETGRPQVVGDMVVSGTGMRTLHAFFTGNRHSAREVTARLTPEAPEAEWFARFLGRACQDYVLHTLALGGVFLTGGLLAGNPLLVQHPAFMRELHSNDRYGELLRNIPVFLNTNEDFGLWGAAQRGVEMLRQH